MRTRTQGLNTQRKWDKEWARLKEEGRVVGSVSGMFDELPRVLLENPIEKGWHWCILLQSGNRGQVTQIDCEPTFDVEVDGKQFRKLNELLIIVKRRKFHVPVYQEKQL